MPVSTTEAPTIRAQECSLASVRCRSPKIPTNIKQIAHGETIGLRGEINGLTLTTPYKTHTCCTRPNVFSFLQKKCVRSHRGEIARDAQRCRHSFRRALQPERRSPRAVFAAGDAQPAAMHSTDASDAVVGCDHDEGVEGDAERIADSPQPPTPCAELGKRTVSSRL